MTNEVLIEKERVHKRVQSFSSGGIIACVVMMQHDKAVAVAMLALQQYHFGNYVVVVLFLHNVVM